MSHYYMDEKTEELRDIFMDVADDEEVTESQAETHGSLSSETEVDERLRNAVEEMRDNLDVDTDLATDDLTDLVKTFYAGESDAEIAAELDADVDAAAVADTRYDLHLLRDADTDADFDLDALRERRGEDADPADLADDLDGDEDAVERCLRVLDARDEIRSVNDRYRAEFENALRDRELSERLTSTVHEDGLDDATEGQETDMQL
ncbi:conditioned medium-induced protein 4 [Halobacterium litoreum]|uniref:Conditioned medium-induced protein 4 n=1 Tax=Halobacterium litoreum TaxID=2039234 RepID=A0ABD5NF47_9EURY|nr:conditioned medium-induced protein 4 [Halobacterium litoreum]UHH13425.1 conditioned medium-induced protein 4 [Halobacterium litoreum]